MFITDNDRAQAKQYVYTDALGEELYRILVTPRGDREQQVGGKPEVYPEQVLYQLPRVLGAEEVWFVPDEECVHHLERFDVVATTVASCCGWSGNFDRALDHRTVNAVFAETTAEYRSARFFKCRFEMSRVRFIPREFGVKVKPWLLALTSLQALLDLPVDPMESELPEWTERFYRLPGR